MMIESINLISERDDMANKRTKVKWPPRVRQPARPVKITKIAPLYGPAFLDHAELHARLVNGKTF
jgi:hypothetical protein